MPKLAALVEYAIWVALVILGVLALQYIEWLGCPQDAFICGSASANPNTWAGLIRVILLVFCLVYPVKIALYFLSRINPLKGLFNDRYKSFNVDKVALRGTLLTIIGIFSIYLSTFEKIWASPTIISEQQYIWSAPIKRNWGSVVAVSTWCKRGGRGSWNKGYELIFRDRGKVDLSLNSGSIS